MLASSDSMTTWNGLLATIITACTLLQGCSGSTSKCLPHEIRTSGITPLYLAHKALFSSRDDLPIFSSREAFTGGVMALSHEHTDEQGKFYTIQMGGAIVLSPRHILLTDHQIPNGNHQILYFDHIGLVGTTVIRSIDCGEILNNFQLDLNLEIRELSFPVFSETNTIRLSKNIANYMKHPCWVPISKTDFVRQNGESKTPCQDQEDNTVYVQGTIRQRLNGAVSLSPEQIQLGQFIVELDNYYEMRGSSGYPVLVYDPELGGLVSVGVSIAGAMDPKINKSWLIAVNPFYDEHVFPSTKFFELPLE